MDRIPVGKYTYTTVTVTVPEPILNYPLDDNSTTSIIVDNSTNSLNGTYIDDSSDDYTSTASVTGYLSKALNLGDSYGYYCNPRGILSQTNSIYNLTSNFSLSMIINPYSSIYYYETQEIFTKYGGTKWSFGGYYNYENSTYIYKLYFTIDGVGTVYSDVFYSYNNDIINYPNCVCYGNNWANVGFTYTADGYVKFYANGKNVGIISIGTGTISGNSSTYFAINGTTGSRSFHGYIDDIKFFNSSLTKDQFKKISTDYLLYNDKSQKYIHWLMNDNTSSSTVIDDEFVLPLSIMDGSYTSSIHSSNSKIGTGCFDFSLTSSYLITTNTNIQYDISKNLSLCFWVYVPSTTECGVFFSVGTYGTNGYCVGVGNGSSFSTSGNYLTIYFSNVRWINTGYLLGTGWKHIAFIIDINGYPIVYVNGAKKYIDVGSVALSPSKRLTIGEYNLNCKIDDVRYWTNKTISQNEINAIYCNGNGSELNSYRYSNEKILSRYNMDSNTTIKDNINTYDINAKNIKGSIQDDYYNTTTIKNKIILMHMEGDEQGLSFTEENGNSVTVHGNAMTSKTQYKTGTSSAYFPDSTSYLTIPKTSSMSFGQGDFTIAFWYYATASVSSDYRVLGGSNSGDLFVGMNGSSVGIGRAYQSWDYTVTHSMSLSTWYHFAFVKIGYRIYIYKNGLLLGTTTNTNSYNITSTNLYINASYAGSNGFIGYMDELAITNYPIWRENFTPPLSGMSISENFNSNGKDIFNSNSIFSSDIYKIGNKSLYFSGSSYLYYYNMYNSDFCFPGDFTVDFWFYTTLTTSNYQNMFDCRNNGGSSTGFTVGIQSSRIFFYTGISVLINSSSTVNVNQWYHFAIMRSGSIVTMYLNGSSVGSCTCSNNFSDGYCYIGRTNETDDNSYKFNGYLDEYRISKGIARWTANFTPSSLSYTPDSYSVLLLHMESTNSGIYDGIINKCLYLNGVDQYVKVPSINLSGLYKWSICFWVKTTQNTYSSTYWNNPALFGQATDGGASSDFGICTYNGNIFIWSGLYSSGDIYPYLSSLSYKINDNEWHFICIICDYKKTTLYCDTNYIMHLPCNLKLGNQNYDFGIGCCLYNNTPLYNHNGYFCDFRIYEKDISFKDMRSIYNDGNGSEQIIKIETDLNNDIIANYQVKNSSDYLVNDITLKYDMIVNGLAEIKNGGHNGGNYISFDSSKQPLITFNGNAKISTATSVFGNSCLYLDGNNSFVNIYNCPYILSGDFTIDFWVRLGTQSNSDAAIFSNLFYGVQAGSVELNYNYSTYTKQICLWIYNYNSSVSPILTSGILTSLTWHHIAIVRSGSTIKMYIDGIAKSSSTYSGVINLGGSSNYLYIGGGTYTFETNNYFKGHIDEFRIIDGTALWLTDFSIPTTETVDKNCSLLLHFNGNNGDTTCSILPQASSLECKSFYGPTMYGEYSISFWIKTNSTEKLSLFSWGNSSWNSDSIWWYGNSTFPSGVGSGSISITTANYAVGTANTGYNDGNWHHVVLVNNGSGMSNYKVYVDAISYSMVYIYNSQTITSTNNILPFKFGYPCISDNTGTAKGISIEDIKIYNRALSLMEIKVLYNI